MFFKSSSLHVSYSRKKEFVVFFLALLLYLFKSLSHFTHIPVMRFYTDEIHLTEQQTGKLVHFDENFGRITSVASAILADLFVGIYPILIFGLILSCISSFMLSFLVSANSFSMVWALTLFAGFSKGMLEGVFYTFVISQFDTERSRPKINALTLYGFYQHKVVFSLLLIFVPDVFKLLGNTIPFYTQSALFLVFLFAAIVPSNFFFKMNPTGVKEKKENICSAETRSKLFSMLITIILVTPFYLLYVLSRSSWIFSGNQMNKNIRIFNFSFDIKPQQLVLTNTLAILVFLPLIRSQVTFKLVEKHGKHLVLAIGMIILILSYVYNMVIDYISITSSKKISILWQTISYTLFTLAEAIFCPTYDGYLYLEAPPGYKNMVLASNTIISGTMGIIIITFIKSSILIKKKYGKIYEQAILSGLCLCSAITILILRKFKICIH